MNTNKNLPDENFTPASCQTNVSGSAFSIHDLKCGNILNYDTAEGENLPNVIDWQDLRWLTEDPKGFNLVYSGIELSNDNLLKLGFKLYPSGYMCLDILDDKFYISIGSKYDKEPNLIMDNGENVLNVDLKKIRYVHELQNFYYCLTGVMLSLS